jgi:protein-disulfide isomerase
VKSRLFGRTPYVWTVRSLRRLTPSPHHKPAFFGPIVAADEWHAGFEGRKWVWVASFPPQRLYALIGLIDGLEPASRGEEKHKRIEETMSRPSAIARNCLIACSAIAFVLASGVRLSAQTATATNPAPGERNIEQAVHDYILAHPEVLIESLQAAKRKADQLAATNTKSVIGSFKKELVDDPDSPIFGNPAGDVTLVEFFDYRCPYCRQLDPTLQTLIREDPGVRIVQKEYPILGDASVFAARVVLAAQKQGKYAKLNEALMARKPNIDQATVLKLAEAAGLDLDRIKADMNGPDVNAEIEHTVQIAKALRLAGTPAFIAGTQIIPGGTDLESLKSLIDDARHNRDQD